MIRVVLRVFTTLFLLGAVRASPALASDSAEVDFQKEIAPILEQSCVKCHGPEKQKSEFRVDDYDFLLKGGDSGIPGVIPGNVGESYLHELVTAEDEDDRMPPDGKDPLSADQIALIERWIEQGAKRVALPPQTYDFLTHVQPIFQKNCYHCHGPDKQESEMRTDLRASLLKGGGTGAPAIVPGDIAEGEMLKRLHSTDKEFRMPRDANPLPDGDLKIIATWIAEGAYWPGQMNAVLEKETTTLWSMQPLTTPKIPRSKKKNPIDAFLETRLAEHRIHPNPTADPQALIRRVSIILTGLPATPERIESFVTSYKKNAKKAYGALIDELFASPHFGERWAQHWLDVIRWAETTGYESNEFRKNAWPYRDYVVDAFNDDKPYDQFVREQIAGDSLGQDLAMGFLVAGPHAPGSTVGQNPDDQKQARFDRLDETIQTVGSSMMGVTMGCARCHNHKFDPVSIKDYYSMAAVFNDIEYDYRVPRLPESDPREAAGRAIMDEIAKERSGFAAGEGWTEKWPDHVKALFPTARAKSIRFHFNSDKFTLDEIQLYSAADSTLNLTQADGIRITSSKKEESPSRPVEFLIDDRLDNFFVWKHEEGDSASDPWVQIDLPEPTSLSRTELSVNRLAHYGWQYMINRNGSVVGGDAPKALLSIEVMDENGAWKTVVDTDKANQSSEYKKRIARLNALAERHDQEAPPPVFIGKLIKPTMMHVMHRGSPTSPRAEVAPAGLEILDGDFGLAKNAPGPERRLTFAEWVASPENPLTARVAVNRLWYHVFGAGIVTTPGDFGFAGGTPSHPDLLDWLASDFIEHGWSTKAMLRQMVSSEAFMRSSAPSDEWLAIDADSKLLWRFPPRWLEAEVLRDSILQASGALDDKVGGEGYHIYTPKTRYDQWKVTDNHGPHTWRRMLYQQRMRRVDDQMFTAFDFPSCAQVQSKRPRSTTPLQALNLLNGDLVVEQSELLAKRAMREAGDNLDTQLQLMFKLTLGRAPSGDELSITSDLAKSDGLSSVARALINLNEFFYLN